MGVLEPDFIESVITPETETTNPSETMEISREFYGMEAVAQFAPKRNETTESEKNGGDE